MTQPTENHSDSRDESGAGSIVRAQRRPKWLLSGLRYRLSRLRKPVQRSAPQHVLDNIGQHDPRARQISFTFSVIALSARVACADNKLTATKYALFRESFPLEDSMCGKIRSLFILACHNQTPLDYYLSQMRHAYPGQKALLTAVVDRLFRIAAADGDISATAESLLAEIALGLDISTHNYSRLLARHLRPHKPYHGKAYHVLGLDKHARREAVKSRYYELMRRYHPDAHAGNNLSPELTLLLQLKSAEINEAYRMLAKKAA